MTDVDFSKQLDQQIYECLNLNKPNSFFLFAGAGSGKTRSLVEILKKFRENNIQHIRLNSQKVAIITYTNAACDEIKHRLEFDSAFTVSTIHSFSWDLIKPHQNDIRNWLRNHIELEIADLELKQTKGRAGTKASKDRSRQILSKSERLKNLKSISRFTYNPNGDNTTRDSLSHSEVINITSEFLLTSPLFQKILICSFPILLIDESQDTNQELIDGFFKIQELYPDSFSLGLFGDTMQRIYMDGKPDLGVNIPKNWITPVNPYNHRCPKRVITLINKIRSYVDDQKQIAATTNEEGIIRLFIVDNTTVSDKSEFEKLVSAKMAEMSGDDEWNNLNNGVKTLILEHHMAAKRGGFSTFFDPLYNIDRIQKTGIIKGTLNGIPLFANQILPLIVAMRSADKFTVCRLVLKYSSLLDIDILKRSQDPRKTIDIANNAVNALYSLWDEKKDPSLNDILKEVYRSGLFHVPDVILPIAARLNDLEEILPTVHEDDSDKDEVINAWEEALKCSFSQFEEYVRYISDQSPFGTHQGIKGLQFPRVMVILDDEDSRGFLFSYEKLFGAKEPSETDIKNESEGKETSIDRTRRLFYVTCSRAEKSLAIIAYSNEPGKVKNHVTSNGWFKEDEVVYSSTILV